jgi:hypothetical protein
MYGQHTQNSKYSHEQKWNISQTAKTEQKTKEVAVTTHFQHNAACSISWRNEDLVIYSLFEYRETDTMGSDSISGLWYYMESGTQLRYVYEWNT